jgi:hypothetical protein
MTHLLSPAGTPVDRSAIAVPVNAQHHGAVAHAPIKVPKKINRRIRRSSSPLQNMDEISHNQAAHRPCQSP